MRSVVRLFAVVLLGLHAVPGLSAQQPGTPTKITHVDPVYPEQARQARVQGIVMVQITVGTDGRVSNARVIRSIPMLDQAALDAVKQWVYDAATIKAPVTLTVTVPFGVSVPAETIARPRPTQPAASAPSVTLPDGTTGTIVRCEPKPDTTNATHDLGVAYFRKGDTARALACFFSAAERGHAPAMHTLGEVYRVLDLSQSFEWYLKSARAGNAPAMAVVSAAYNPARPSFSGPANPQRPPFRGIAKNAAEAFSWGLKAVNRGNGEAMLAVSEMYATGIGTGINPGEANRWSLAHDKAKSVLGEIGYLGKDGTVERVIQIIAGQLGHAPAEIKLSARLVEDLGADSLDLIELVLAFEEEFYIEITGDNEASMLCDAGRAKSRCFTTVDRIAAFVVKEVEATLVKP